MITITYPEFSEHEYPTGEADGSYDYPATGRKGPIGELTCSKCGAVFWHPDLEKCFYDEIHFAGMEVDCDCKKTFAAFHEFKEHRVDLGYKDDGTGMTMYQLYLNHSSDHEVMHGPASNEPFTTGVIGHIRCPLCTKRINPHQEGTTGYDKDHNTVICCTCHRCYILPVEEDKAEPREALVYREHIVHEGKVRGMSYGENQGYLGDLTCDWCNRPFILNKRSQNQTVILCENCGNRAAVAEDSVDSTTPSTTVTEDPSKVTPEQQDFIEDFFLVEEEEEMDENDPLAGFFNK